MPKHQTSNAANESNWEEACPGSEGCEGGGEVGGGREGEGETRGSGLGVVGSLTDVRFRVVAHRLIPTSILTTSIVAAGQQPLQN